MFRMRYQIPKQTVHQPPVPSIQIQPVMRPLAIASPVVLGNIYGAMYSGGPCSSCGGK
jgi:hypothetical protein